MYIYRYYGSRQFTVPVCEKAHNMKIIVVTYDFGVLSVVM